MHFIEENIPQILLVSNILFFQETAVTKLLQSMACLYFSLQNACTFKLALGAMHYNSIII
jgi:hypothetical protein